MEPPGEDGGLSLQQQVIFKSLNSSFRYIFVSLKLGGSISRMRENLGPRDFLLTFKAQTCHLLILYEFVHHYSPIRTL